ncbi:MAG: hypothetical protein U0559_10655 [Anaerolineae bacterium]
MRCVQDNGDGVRRHRSGVVLACRRIALTDKVGSLVRDVLRPQYGVMYAAGANSACWRRMTLMDVTCSGDVQFATLYLPLIRK